MPFKFAQNTAIGEFLATAEGVCTVEEALPLLEFLQSHRTARIGLDSCTHLHTAILQVLLAVRPPIAALPQETFLARWLSPMLETPEKKAAR